MPENEQITIRRAVSLDDAACTLSMIEELADFEKLSPPNDDAKDRFVQDGFVRQPPRFEVWLAVDGDLALGYALIFETYSSFLCKPTLYLEDLYVSPSFRRGGVGTRLLEHCRSLAAERGCGRMEWTCLDWNTRAQDVYEGMGAKKMSEWLLYRLTEELF